MHHATKDEGHRVCTLRARRWSCVLSVCAVVMTAPILNAQAVPATTGAAQSAAAATSQIPTFTAAPLAIVPLDKSIPGAAFAVDGALQAWNGRVYLTGSGSITAGTSTADVVLPLQGLLRVCSSTTVRLAADKSAPEGETPGLLIALDRGAVEMSFAPSKARAKNAATLMTPYFHILIGGPSAAEVRVRLGEHGDTCVDNSGAEAAYVLVSSAFDGGLYRVQPGQRAMLERGSLQSVVDQEKEPCGCPPTPGETHGNEFPLAQSEGLTPGSQVPVASAGTDGGTFSYNGSSRAGDAAASGATEQVPPDAKKAHKHKAKQGKTGGFFDSIGHFFKWLFGGE